MSREKKKTSTLSTTGAGGQLPVGWETERGPICADCTYCTRVDHSSKSQHIVAGSTLTADPE
jgi:hypothetical protein